MKESVRWVEGVRAARAVAIACPKTKCICVADSEADIYELFAEPLEAGPQNNLHLLIRACHDRVLTDSDQKLLGTVRTTECLYRCVIDVSSRKAKTNVKTSKRRQTRDARVAEVEIRAATVTLSPPYRNDRTLPERTINVVLVEETNPPDGEEPIRWILLTTLPIDTSEMVKQIVEYYCIRWQIEIYFKTLKSGCRIEERYFERIGRLLNCLAVYTIVAWKILYLCRLARDCPEMSCEVVFEPSQWQPVYLIVKKNKLPATPPTLNEMVRMIASLGGYVIRTKTRPGTQTLWLGLQRLHDMSTAWEIFGPNSQHPPKQQFDETCVVR
jgi:Transposase Tn5 dimerisation domain